MCKSSFTFSAFSMNILQFNSKSMWCSKYLWQQLWLSDSRLLLQQRKYSKLKNSLGILSSELLLVRIKKSTSLRSTLTPATLYYLAVSKCTTACQFSIQHSTFSTKPSTEDGTQLTVRLMTH